MDDEDGKSSGVVPEYLAKRLKLGPSTLPLLKIEEYSCSVARAWSPPTVWSHKKTRANLVFYYTHESHGGRRKKRPRDDDDDAIDAEATTDAIVYIPLEPGHRLWVSVRVDQLDDLLWRRMPKAFEAMIQWYVSFLQDSQLSHELTLHSKTLLFLKDMSDASESKKNLNVYIELENDGSVHPERRPPVHSFRCLV